MKPTLAVCSEDTWTLVKSDISAVTLFFRSSSCRYYLLPVDAGDEAPSGVPVTEETSAKLLDNGESYWFSSAKDIYVYAVNADGLLLIYDSAGAGGGGSPFYSASFLLLGEAPNTEAYLHTFRPGWFGDFPSGSSLGLSEANPFLVPSASVVVSALVTIPKAGVSALASEDPVTVTFAIDVIGEDSAVQIGTLEFTLQEGLALGSYVSSPVMASASLTPSISLPAGALIGVRFVPGTGASEVSYVEDVYMTLLCEV